MNKIEDLKNVLLSEKELKDYEENYAKRKDINTSYYDENDAYFYSLVKRDLVIEDLLNNFFSRQENRSIIKLFLDNYMKICYAEINCLTDEEILNTIEDFRRQTIEETPICPLIWLRMCEHELARRKTLNNKEEKGHGSK